MASSTGSRGSASPPLLTPLSHRPPPPSLPPSVFSLHHAPTGTLLHIIPTVPLSPQAQADTAAVLAAVRPDAVVVQLSESEQMHLVEEGRMMLMAPAADGRHYTSDGGSPAGGVKKFGYSPWGPVTGTRTALAADPPTRSSALDSSGEFAAVTPPRQRTRVLQLEGRPQVATARPLADSPLADSPLADSPLADSSAGSSARPKTDGAEALDEVLESRQGTGQVEAEAVKVGSQETGGASGRGEEQHHRHHDGRCDSSSGRPVSVAGGLEACHRTDNEHASWQGSDGTRHPGQQHRSGGWQDTAMTAPIALSSSLSPSHLTGHSPCVAIPLSASPSPSLPTSPLSVLATAAHHRLSPSHFLLPAVRHLLEALFGAALHGPLATAMEASASATSAAAAAALSAAGPEAQPGVSDCKGRSPGEAPHDCEPCPLPSPSHPSTPPMSAAHQSALLLMPAPPPSLAVPTQRAADTQGGSESGGSGGDAGRSSGSSGAGSMAWGPSSSRLGASMAPASLAALAGARRGSRQAGVAAGVAGTDRENEIRDGENPWAVTSTAATAAVAGKARAAAASAAAVVQAPGVAAAFDGVMAGRAREQGGEGGHASECEGEGGVRVCGRADGSAVEGSKGGMGGELTERIWSSVMDTLADYEEVMRAVVGLGLEEQEGGGAGGEREGERWGEAEAVAAKQRHALQQSGREARGSPWMDSRAENLERGRGGGERGEELLRDGRGLTRGSCADERACSSSSSSMSTGGEAEWQKAHDTAREVAGGRAGKQACVHCSGGGSRWWGGRAQLGCAGMLGHVRCSSRSGQAGGGGGSEGGGDGERGS